MKQRLTIRGRPFDIVCSLEAAAAKALAKICGYEACRCKIDELRPRDADIINSMQMFSASDFGDQNIRVRYVTYKGLLVFYVWGCAAKVCEYIKLPRIEIVVEGALATRHTLYIIGACLPEDYELLGYE